MPRLRTRRSIVTLALLVVFLGSAATTSGANTSSRADVSGRVRDVGGNSLSDVEVLVVAPSLAVHPVATVRSDAAGVFTIVGLPPGTYRIAVLKHGYLTFVGKINTQVQTWLDVVLHPAPVAEQDPEVELPRNSAWSLRLPRRSILRETDAPIRLAREGERDERADTTAPHGSPLSLEVEQRFALKRGLREAEGERPGGTGTQTRLRMASSIGERAFLRLQGTRESYDSSRSARELTSSAREGAAALHLGLSYDATADSQVEIKAYYSKRDLRLSSGIDDLVAPAQMHDRRSWGYDAAWKTQIDPASSLEVKLDYKNTTLSAPSRPMPTAPQAEATEPGPIDAFANRSVGAVGSYRSLPSADHRVQVDLRAKILESQLAVEGLPVAGLNHGSFDASDGVPGVSLGLEAQDTWHVSGPFALIYGLGYKHALAGQDVSLFAPRLGGTWTASSMVLKFLVSYHEVARWGRDREPLATLPFRPEGRVGYEAELELPISRGLRVMGATRSSPIQFDSLGYPPGALDPDMQPVYVTDGNAAVEEHRVALVREGAGGRIYWELASGTVEGTLAPVSAFQTSCQWMSDRRLRYHAGRVGVRVASSGTDVLVDYRQILEASASRETTGFDIHQHSVSLRLTQDLFRLRTLGDWRFLLALRAVSFEADDGAEALQQDEAPWLSQMNREMSAGLSVLF